MSLIRKKIKNLDYYYLSLSFRYLNKTKNFRKYIGSKKPSSKDLSSLEDSFLEEITKKYLPNNYETQYLSKKQLIQILLFNEKYNEKYKHLSIVKKNKLDIDKLVLFTLTTLTTEDVDVSLQDVLEARKKEKNLSQREKICSNMLSAVTLIKQDNKITMDFIRKLHKTAMSSFETKTPGLFRDKQVYIYKKATKDILSAEIIYRPPGYGKIIDLLANLITFYYSSKLNAFEKAVIVHYELYKIHPFLDGNKRV
ncbi:MAG: Fic family protein, partial [archaeon]